jgi:hypothetical protein
MDDGVGANRLPAPKGNWAPLGLAGLSQGDDLVDDDFGYRVINITVEQERVMKCGPHHLDVLRLDVVPGKWHLPLSVTPTGWPNMSSTIWLTTVCRRLAASRVMTLARRSEIADCF